MPRTSVRAALAALVALSLPTLSVAASATAVADDGDAVVTLVSPTNGADVASVVVASFDVDLQAQDETTVLAQIGTVTRTRTVTRSDCPSTCRVDLELRTADSFDSPQPGGAAALHYEWTTPSGGGSVGIWVTLPVVSVAHRATSTVTSTANTPGYASSVVDTTSTFVYRPESPSVQPAPGEVVEVRVYRQTGAGPDAGEVRRETVDWVVPSGSSPTATTVVDFSALSEGSYAVVSRGRAADGSYGDGTYRVVVVRHSPSLVVTTDPAPQLADVPRVAYASMRGPLAKAPTAVEVSVDGVVVSTSSDPRLSTLTRETGSLTEGFDLGSRPLGTHVVSARLTAGLSGVVGVPASASFDVVSLGIRVAPPVAFVGRAAAASATATAPVGRVVEQLHGEVSDPSGLLAHGDWCGLCGTQSVRGSMSFTPRVAGTARYTVWASAGDPLVESASGSFPVYAYRRVAALSAPATRYGSVQKVAVRLTDDRGTGAVAAPSAVALTLQLRKAGTTTWTTVASGRTTTGGVAALTYTSRANGQLRVAYATPAPGVTWLSGAVGVTSVAAVYVTSAPTTAVRNRTVTVKASTYPYQSGATVSLQTRVRGTSTWRTVRTVAATTSGAATLTTAFSSRATYEVRIVRSATSLNASGVSPVRTIAVS